MNRLCRDIIIHICGNLLDSEIAMFSITNKYLIRTIPRTVRLLDCFIRDSNLNWIKLAEEWGCSKWDHTSYIELGLTGNIEIFSYKAFSKYFFVKSYTLPEYFTESVYNGACYGGHIELLKFIDSHSTHHHYEGMRYAANSRNYPAIEYLIAKHPDTIHNISGMAIQKLDTELIKYCLDKNIKIKVLDGMNKDTDPEKLDSFLRYCEKEGVKFSKTPWIFDIKIGIVLLNHDLYNYHRIDGHVCQMLFESRGLINWKDKNHIKLVDKCIAFIMLNQNTFLVDYLRMKDFLKREGYSVDLDKYKQKILQKQ